ncbi:MAG: efflux transporter outer membrane subunit [Desulfobulbus sp.]|uniref:efflux transporter outer membrane subunit n=1 Tax=Desulfobulbus sp. TaxID=895 RepID=UPI0028411904|nr:efflux transporter outer membrane subunit [Desulfobulbus sp.]MDR2549159.1 efflux transporter outer membrane subunit [Desulfobulbus sp.]
MRRILVSTLCCTLLLSGCGNLIRTPYHRPDVELPPEWVHGQDATRAMEDRWWTAFSDPALDRLIAEALQRNNDLAIAALRLRRAQLQAEQADSDRLPGLRVEAGASHSKNLRRDRKTDSFTTSVFSSYAVDLWGQLASTSDAAHWEARATEDDLANTALALTGTTALLYWQIGYLNQRIELGRASIAYARRTLELVRVQKAAGAATNLEILETERNVASQEANQTTLIQQRVEAINQLAILFDGPPKSLAIAEPENLEGMHLPKVAAGLPAYLLARRPDMRAAEARLRASLATTDATRASFYPTITLSGSLGGSSEELSRIIRDPIGTLAANLALPFVQWRDMRRSIALSETEYEQTVVTFRQTLYNALAEVENGLSARQQYQEQADKLERSLDMARQVEALYQVRYQAGGSPLKSWLDAQESRRQAEIALAANRFDQLVNHISLVKALGGGVEVPTTTRQ